MRQDLMAGIAMTIAGGLIIFIFIPYGVVEPKNVKFAALSPSYYPRIIAIALLIIGVVISCRAFLAKETAKKESSDQRADAFTRTSMIFAILAFYAVTINWLGFIIASTLVLSACFWVAGERRLKIVLLIAILLPLILYFFFLKVAGIPIPLGILKPILAGV